MVREAKPVRKHGGPWQVRGMFMMAVALIAGCVFILVGISNVQHASQIRQHGVTVNATVIQNQGWGRNAVRVSYATAAGQQEQGTLNTPNDAASYPVGSAITAVYDPSSPSTVTLPGSGAGGGWAEVGIGAGILLLLAIAGGRAWLRGARLAGQRTVPL
jgi:hypothetical protein